MFSEGDVTTIKLPDRLKFANELSFPIKNHAGDIIAYAEIHSNTKTITLTYTNFVSSNSDVSGSFYFLTSADSIVVKEDVTVPIELDVDGKLVFVGDIDYEIEVPKESEFDKSGWFEDGSNRIVRYALDINKSKKSYKNAVVRDLLSTTGAKIDKDSIRIQKGQWVINDSNTQWYLLNEIDVTNQYIIKSNSDQSGFEIDLGDIGVNDGFTIMYQAHLDYTPVEGEKINNKATFTTDQI